MHRKIKVILSVLCVLMAAVFSGTAVNAAATTNLPPTTSTSASIGGGTTRSAAGGTTYKPATNARGQTYPQPKSRPTSALATRPAETAELPTGFLISDQDGVSANSKGEYFIEALGLMPGDVIKKTVTIQNLEKSGGSQTDIPFLLSMRTEPVIVKGPVDLLEEVSLELKLDGKVIYTGNCRGDKGTDGEGRPYNMIATPADLGLYKIGDRRDMEITLRVNTAMKLNTEVSEALFRWVFYAVKAEESKPPDTGFMKSYGLYFIPLGGTALLGLFLVLKKKKRERDERLQSLNA